MKKMSIVLFLVGLLWCIASSVQAQTGIRFGVKAGYSLGLQYGILPKDNPYDVDSDSRHGLSGGILLYFPITEAFGVQQEFLYTNKGSTQHVSMAEPFFRSSSEYKLNYFEMPILFRYTFAKIGDFGIFGSTGFGLSMLLGGEYTTDGEIEIEEFTRNRAIQMAWIPLIIVSSMAWGYISICWINNSSLTIVKPLAGIL